MKFCEKCFRRGTREKGRWITTHFTDEHKQGQAKSTSDKQANVAQDSEAPPASTDSPASPKASKRAIINSLVDKLLESSGD